MCRLVPFGAIKRKIIITGDCAGDEKWFILSIRMNHLVELLEWLGALTIINLWSYGNIWFKHGKRPRRKIFWNPRLFKFRSKIINFVGPFREIPAQTCTLGLWAGLPTLPFSVSSSRFLCHFLSYENIKVVGQKNKK